MADRLTKKIDVSVVIPAFDVGDYIGEAIDSVARQDGPEVEIIVIDDGSTDATPDVLDRYADRPCIRIHRQSNQGLSAARNKGVALAIGRYVLFVDGDDVLRPDALRRMVERAHSDRCDVVVGDHDRWDPAVDERSPRHRNASETTVDTSVFGHFATGEFGQIACNKLIRGSLARRLRFHDRIIYEDTLYCPQLFLRARRVGRLRQTTYDHRRRPGSVLDSRTARHIESMCDVLHLLSDLYWTSELADQERIGFAHILRRRTLLLRRWISELGDCPDLDRDRASNAIDAASSTFLHANAATGATADCPPPAPPIAPPVAGMLRRLERRLRALRKRRRSGTGGRPTGGTS